MIVQFDKHQGDVVKNFLAGQTTAEEVPHPDGHGLVALKETDGTYVSMTPGGDFQKNATTPGSWERWYPAGGVYIHQQSGAGIRRFVGEVPKLP